MARVKRGTIANKRRKALLKHTKGFRWGRKTKFKAAKQAVFKAWSYAYRDRRVKKRTFRQAWQSSINALSRQSGLSYSKFAAKLKQNNIGLDRKILALLAKEYPQVFTKIVQTVQGT